VDPFHEVERHEKEFVPRTYEKQNALEKKGGVLHACGAGVG
jgi:hypothetical protein